MKAPVYLAWKDGRWHLDGRPIYAGNFMEICWPDGTWELVRIESGDGGHSLRAYFQHHGQTASHPVANRDAVLARLRWPSGSDPVTTSGAAD